MKKSLQKYHSITVDCISDLHGEYPALQGGDLLIIAGDITASDKFSQWVDFYGWFNQQNYMHKVIVGGNHDNFLFDAYPKNKQEADEMQELQSFLKNNGEMNSIEDFDYLCDSGIDLNFKKSTSTRTLKIWGSPWTKCFPGMHEACKAFTVDTEEELADKWSLIPHDTDILITHCPPYGILDGVHRMNSPEVEYTGSPALFKALGEIKPKLHVFGHIHEHGGKRILLKHIDCDTVCVNAAIMDKVYEPVYRPNRIIL